MNSFPNVTDIFDKKNQLINNNKLHFLLKPDGNIIVICMPIKVSMFFCGHIIYNFNINTKN